VPLLLTALTGPVLAWTAWPLLDRSTWTRAAPLADLLAGGASALALLVWAWLALGMAACWHAAVRGAPSAPGWTPRLARVLVAGAVGIALPTVDASADTTGLLHGLQVPDRTVGTVATVRAGQPDRQSALVVRPGDCLWDLAESRLPRAASPADVDRAWRALYRWNRSRVGPDPDLLRPGTRLVPPPGLMLAPHPGESR
jgi:hypothetical protein